MRILTRYVLFDLLKVFSLTVAALTLLFFIVLLGKEAVDKGIGLDILLQIVPYMLPQAMQFALPAAMLLATSSVFGRMASYNEIVAVKSLGISPMVFIWPTLILATLVSFGAVITNDIAVSWGMMGQQRVILASMEEILYRQLASKNTYPFGKATMTVRGVEGKKLIAPTLVIQKGDGQAPWIASAENAELHMIRGENKLVLSFHDLSVDGPAKWINPETQEFVASLEDLTGASPKNRSPSNYALKEIAPAITEQEQVLDKARQSNVAQAAFGLLTGDFDSLSNVAWKPREKDIEVGQQRLYRLHTEPWRRWANGFSCLCFVLVGIPVAVHLRSSEFIASFFSCFLPILIAYYPLLAVSVDKAKDGFFPPYCVWLGNLVLAAAGIWMLRRVNRH